MLLQLFRKLHNFSHIFAHDSQKSFRFEILEFLWTKLGTIKHFTIANHSILALALVWIKLNPHFSLVQINQNTASEKCSFKQFSVNFLLLIFKNSRMVLFIEMKYSNCYSIFLLKIRLDSYLAKNIQKATLNFYFKSRFSVKPSELPIYFAIYFDCSWK